MSDASILSNLASQASPGGTPPALKPGQVVAAKVMALLSDGMVRLALPQGTVDVAPPQPLVQGTIVRLEVVKAGADLVLRMTDPASPAPTASGTPPQPASLPQGATSAPQLPAMPAAARQALPQPIPVSLPPEAARIAGNAPTLEGRVVALGQDGAIQVATPKGTLTVTARLPVPLGVPVRIDMPPGGQPTLSILSAPAQGNAPARGATPSAVAPAAQSVSPPTTPLSSNAAASAPAAPQGAQVSRFPSSTGETAARPQVSSGSAQGSTLPGAPSAPLPAGAPRAILLPALQTSLGRQQALAPLMANLDAAAGAKAGAAPTLTPDISEGLPTSVREAAGKVLDARLPLDENLSGDDIARAVANSGIMFEAKLASGAPPANLTGDLKGALLLLRNALQSFVGAGGGGLSAPGTDLAKAAKDIPHPPLRGDPPSAQKPAAATIMADAPPEEIGRTLLGQTEGALARTRLMQIASLPDDVSGPRAQAPAPLHVEIPVVMGQQNAVAQFTVERDGHGQSDGQTVAPVWRMRFALDIEPMGPVHAMVMLQAGVATINLWAERPETAQELYAASSDLRTALDDAEFAVEEVVVRRGAPPRPERQPGGVLDRRT